MRIYFNTTETSVLLFYANSWLPAPLLLSWVVLTAALGQGARL